MENVKGFEQAVQRLLSSSEASKLDNLSKLYDFVDGCRFYCSGNLAWRLDPLSNLKYFCTHLATSSLSTQRYGINCDDMSHGVHIQLGPVDLD